MADYAALVEKYKGRKKDTLIDSVTCGLSYADNVAMDLGLLENSDILEAVTTAAPFAVIAVTEELQVILGKKTGKAGLSDAVQRMFKTGTAMGVGAIAATVAGPIAAVPAAVGTRVLMKKYQSKALLTLRVQDRLERLKALRRRQNEKAVFSPDDRPLLPGGMEYLDLESGL